MRGLSILVGLGCVYALAHLLPADGQTTVTATTCSPDDIKIIQANLVDDAGGDGDVV